MENIHTRTNLITPPPPKKNMKGKKGGEVHLWQGSKISGEWKPSLATVYQKAQLSPIHFILGSKVVTTYSSSERAKGTENAEDKPPTSKMTGLSGKCSKL